MMKSTASFGFLLLFAYGALLADSNNKSSKRGSRVVTAVKRLRPGETPVQTPGWTHCVTDMKVTPSWRKLKSPGYPKLASNQMQCSWILEAPIGWRVMITFKDLQMSPATGDGPEKSCRTSYVNIIDMTAQTTQGKFCGNSPPGDYVTLGSVLRIDLQGDKSEIIRRGFIISYTMTRDAPGFRAPRKQQSPSDNTPGKVNFNEFKSNQQKLINSQAVPQRKYSIPKKLIYASDTTTAKATTTTVANEGWIGDVALPKGPGAPTKRTGGAKVQARKITVKPASSASKPKNNGNRIRASNQQQPASNPNNAASNDGNGGRIRDNSASEGNDDYWTGVGNNPGPIPDGQVPRIYGHRNQPSGRAQIENKPGKMDMNGNYVLMKGDEGVTTVQLIIIIVGVLACIVLVFTVFLIKKFCIDAKEDDKKSKKKRSKMDESPYFMNNEMNLPGLSKSGSLHSMASIHDNFALSRHMSLAPTEHHMTLSRKSATNGEMSRHQSLVAKHEAIYRNHMAMLKNSSANPSLQRRSFHGSRSNINRPLPPVPDKKEKSKPIDVDEDYCSGSNEDVYVTTMKREMSEWEIQQQKQEKRNNRYL